MDSPQDASQPANQMPKAAAWAVIIVILLILGVGGYFLIEHGSGANNANIDMGINSNRVSNNNAVSNQSNQYSNTELGFTVSVPKNWYVQSLNNSSATSYATEGVALGCLSNYQPNLELHPQAGEIQVCFNAFKRAGMALQNWYAAYDKSESSNHLLYESVTNESTTLNGYPAIDERIKTGTTPRQRKDTEWLDGRIRNYYLIAGEYILQIEGIVLESDSSLLEATTNIAQSIKF